VKAKQESKTRKKREEHKEKERKTSYFCQFYFYRLLMLMACFEGEQRSLIFITR